MPLSNLAIDDAMLGPSQDAIPTPPDASAAFEHGHIELPHRSANPVHSLQRALTRRLAPDGEAVAATPARQAQADLAGRIELGVAALSRLAGPVLLVAAVAAIVAVIV